VGDAVQFTRQIYFGTGCLHVAGSTNIMVPVYQTTDISWRTVMVTSADIQTVIVICVRVCMGTTENKIVKNATNCICHSMR